MAAVKKLVFAQQLRGIAALLIVITHYFGNFYGSQSYLAGLTFSPDLRLQAAPWVRWFDFPGLKGPFGVAVFFLISGFVIPFSLGKAGPARFLLMRWFRIYPTYFTAFAVSMLVLAINAHYWQLPFTHSLAALVSNALLVNNLAGIDSVDPINWTLSIEIKFYLVAAAGGGLLFGQRFRYLAVFAAGLLAATALVARMAQPPAFLSALALEWNYLIFMLIGVGFYQHIKGMISLPALGARSAYLMAVFSLNWWLGPQRAMFPVINVYYYYAFAAFALCYLARAHFRPVRLLDFFADISYPLYVTHSLIGFVLLKNLVHAGLPFQFAVAATLAVAVALAYALHRSVELRSNALGKRLAAAAAPGTEAR